MAGNSMFKNEGKVLTVSSWLRVFVGGGVKQAEQVRCGTICTDSIRISQTAAWKADVNERECENSSVNACVNNNNNTNNNIYKHRELQFVLYNKKAQSFIA